jgi:hypothetical protein
VINSGISMQGKQKARQGKDQKLMQLRNEFVGHDEFFPSRCG